MKTLCIVLILVSILFLTLALASEVKNLTLEQLAEDKNVLYIAKELREKIPLNTIVTKQTIEIVKNQIATIIIKTGYLKEDYSIQSIFCLLGHIHFKIKIKSKTQYGYYELESMYFFKSNTEDI